MPNYSLKANDKPVLSGLGLKDGDYTVTLSKKTFKSARKLTDGRLLLGLHGTVTQSVDEEKTEIAKFEFDKGKLLVIGDQNIYESSEAGSEYTFTVKNGYVRSIKPAQA